MTVVLSFFVGCLLLFLALGAGRWLTAQPPARLAQGLRRGGGVLLLALAALFLVRGNPAFAGLAGTAGLALMGLLPGALGRAIGGGVPPGPGRRSTIESRWLRMTLDHDTGATEAEILDGPFAGRRLDGLDDGELASLLDACRADDPRGAALLEAWLDRERPGWRQRDGAGEADADPNAGDDQAQDDGARGARRRGGMSREDALAVLGLEAGATIAAIRAAHRRLMRQVHPDRGGSDWLAARLNEARDVLLEGGGRSGG